MNRAPKTIHKVYAKIKITFQSFLFLETCPPTHVVYQFPKLAKIAKKKTSVGDCILDVKDEVRLRQEYINNNIWHLHSLSIDECQSYV